MDHPFRPRTSELVHEIQKQTERPPPPTPRVRTKFQQKKNLKRTENALGVMGEGELFTQTTSRFTINLGQIWTF